MATVVNDRDIQLESISPRLAGVSLTANVTVTQAQVDGLDLILSGTKGISLLTTTQVIQVQTDGSETPATITLTANLQNISATPTLTIVSGSGTMSVTPALTAGVFSFTPAQLTSDSITFHLEVTDGGTTYSDDMTVLKVYQGSDGLNALLTNETVTLPADYLGNVTSYAPAAGNFKVYHGTTDVTSVCTFSIPTGGNPDSLAYTLVTSGTSAGSYAVTGGIPSGHDYTSLTIRAAFGTTNIDKVFTIAKAKTGTPGTSGGSGTPGPRGSVTLYVALGGTTATWSDTTAASAITSYTTTAPIKLDVVTEYNNSQNFSVTKFYDGSAWQTVNAVVNGNLLVSGTVAGSALVTNTVDATKIDSRNLTIKDAAGNIIFSAGTIVGNDAATTLGFNPTFGNWTGTFPANWGTWAGGTPVKNTSTVLNGSVASVQWTTTGTGGGMMVSYTPPSPIPAGSFLTGSFSMNVTTNTGGGEPGYLVRLYTNAAQTTFVDNLVPVTDKTVTGWQKMPFTAQAGGATIYNIQIFQMPSWSGMPGGDMASGSVVLYGPFTFDIQSKIQSTQVNPDSGWLNSNVTPSSINAVGSGNPITSGNITTFISAAAIGQTEIGTAAIGTLQVQDAAVTTAKIVDLRTTNYAEDGSGNPTAGAKLASAGTALKVANSSLQVGTVIFTDYWTRLVQGIDGASGTAIIWRGNNDATTRGGAPNINCLTITTLYDQMLNSNFQQTYLNCTLTPTSYTSYSDNLDAMQQIHIQFFAATSSSSAFTECYLPCPSRTYDGASGIVNASLHWGWRYGGTGSSGTSSLHETNNAYDAYVRVRMANTYGWSATKDLYGGGASAAVGRVMTATTITGSTGSTGGGGGGTGGACPAPWVKVALHNGKLVDASDLFDGSVIAAVNDSTMQPMPKGAIVRRPAVIWKKRLQVTLTDGRKTEWSYGHRFCLVGGEWVAIQDLRPGDHIMGPVENIVESILPTGEGPVVTFQVEGAGTYFAGDMLSHNNKLIP